MSLKFVYALISNADDYYAEQTLISMHTLRYHNPTAHITLVANDDTLSTLTGNRARIKDYIDEYVTVNPPAEFTSVQKSRFIKTSLRQTVEGDFLYIDNDTIIAGSLHKLEELECEMGAVLDLHSTITGNGQLKEYLAITKKEFWGYERYFNGGVLFVRDTAFTHKLFADWHRIWNEELIKYGLSKDQPAFAQANVANGCLITEIEGRYNCQIFMPNGKNYISTAKIIHYFYNSRNKNFYILSILNRLKEEGMTDELNDIVSSPYFILSNYIFLDDVEAKLYTSPMSILGRKLARDFAWTNKVAKFLYKIFGFNI